MNLDSINNRDVEIKAQIWGIEKLFLLVHTNLTFEHIIVHRQAVLVKLLPCFVNLRQK